MEKNMTKQRTLSIIKPDGVARNLIGKIVARFEQEGLSIAAARMTQLSRHEAEGFYAVHKERPFFGELVDSMISGPVLLMVLEGENAILKNREIMGATNPSQAAENTLRKLYSPSITQNTVHGSDAPDTAAFEIAWFFSQNNVFSKK
jgi:nucleoside-diphosphate kinase